MCELSGHKSTDIMNERVSQHEWWTYVQKSPQNDELHKKRHSTTSVRHRIKIKQSISGCDCQTNNLRIQVKFIGQPCISEIQGGW